MVLDSKMHYCSKYVQKFNNSIYKNKIKNELENDFLILETVNDNHYNSPFIRMND